MLRPVLITAVLAILGSSNAAVAGLAPRPSVPPRPPVGVKIIGGEDAIHGQRNFQVSIQDLEYGVDDPYHFCGGTIYSSDTIITSATCVCESNPQYLQIVAGDYNIHLEEGDEQTIKVSQIIKHPQYSVFTLANDIAILKLEKHLKFNHYAQSISLPPNTGVHASGDCIMSGWGSSHRDDDNLSTILQMITLPVLTRENCNTVLSFLEIPGSERQICAGFQGAGKNACIGDDGGPLTCLVNGHTYLAGVLSFDYGCNDNSYPGVYTAIEHYIHWIENTA